MFGLFIIEAGSEPVALLNGFDNKPCVFATGAEAATMAAYCAHGDYYHQWGYSPIKVQPRRLSSDAWKTRELSRFTDGTYVPLPWVDLPKLSLTADHFAHISTEDGARIAYTQDAAKGAGDIQTRVKPGKYLAQFYGDIFDAPTIAKMAAEFSRDFGEANELLFADTASEIERVYVNGPSSCMSHATSSYSSPVHPCTIYAAGDLAVAYMVRDGSITARALCWPEKKLYGRVYGDETRLVDLLETAAFSPGDLDGARMKRIEAGNGFVVPYIDGCQSCSDDGDYLILGEGRVCGGNQNGLSGPSMSCSSCDTDIDEDDCRSDDNGNSYCDDCWSESYGYCERDHEDCDRDTMQAVIVATSPRQRFQSWGENAIDNHAFTCEGNGNVYANEFRVELADGTVWSQEYFEDHGAVCEGNSECYSMDDMVQIEGGIMWSQDYFDDNGIEVDGKLYAKGDEPIADEPEEEATETEETAVAPELSYRYRWQPSPKVSCDEQMSFDAILNPNLLRVELRDVYPGLAKYCVMLRENVLSHWWSIEYAQLDLDRRNEDFASEYQVAA